MNSGNNNSQDEKGGELLLARAPLKWVVKSEELPAGEKQISLHASQKELQELSIWLNEDPEILVKSLCCRGVIKRHKSPTGRKTDEFHVRFKIIACLQQTCVVTLEPIETRIEEDFFQLFVDAPCPVPRPHSNKREEDPTAFNPLEEEPPLPLTNGAIELGPLVCQLFSMAIDPNPRKKGASFRNETKEHDQTDDSLSPFAALKNFKPE